MKNNRFAGLFEVFSRYIFLLLLILLISFSNSVYNIFLIFTIYPLNFLLSFFYNSSIYESMIVIGSQAIDLIPACIGISAYVLLIILNLTTKMPIKKRMYSLIFSVFSLLLLNILRIFLLSVLLINDFLYFEQIHKFLWYFMSIILVIIIWFATAYLFKIKNIPIYSDIKTFYRI